MAIGHHLASSSLPGQPCPRSRFGKPFHLPPSPFPGDRSDRLFRELFPKTVAPDSRAQVPGRVEYLWQQKPLPITGFLFRVFSWCLPHRADPETRRDPLEKGSQRVLFKSIGCSNSGPWGRVTDFCSLPWDVVDNAPSAPQQVHAPLHKGALGAPQAWDAGSLGPESTGSGSCLVPGPLLVTCIVRRKTQTLLRSHFIQRSQSLAETPGFAQKPGALWTP